MPRAAVPQRKNTTELPVMPTMVSTRPTRLRGGIKNREFKPFAVHNQDKPIAFMILGEVPSFAPGLAAAFMLTTRQLYTYTYTYLIPRRGGCTGHSKNQNTTTITTL
jgi:hypothetical protein